MISQHQSGSADPRNRLLLASRRVQTQRWAVLQVWEGQLSCPTFTELWKVSKECDRTEEQFKIFAIAIAEIYYAESFPLITS
jgi:hypothetical protein